MKVAQRSVGVLDRSVRVAVGRLLGGTRSRQPSFGSFQATTSAAIADGDGERDERSAPAELLISTATIGAPTSSASAHDISKNPNDRARHR